MGTTGGDRHKLLKDTEDARVYAVIAPQMGKQVSLPCLYLSQDTGTSSLCSSADPVHPGHVNN